MVPLVTSMICVLVMKLMRFECFPVHMTGVNCVTHLISVQHGGRGAIVKEIELVLHAVLILEWGPVGVVATRHDPENPLTTPNRARSLPPTSRRGCAAV